MANGYWGKVLRVNLNSGEIYVECPSPAVYRHLLGGKGFIGYYLCKELSKGVDPLSPDNLFIVAPGLLTGSMLPATTRTSIGAKSPLTGTFAESEAGGAFGPALRSCGYDAVVFSGKSPKPVYLFLTDGTAELRDGSHLWGKTTGDTRKSIQDELGISRINSILIGPAAERGVKYACVASDLSNTFGRCGLGAVMGGKNLKAVVANGASRVPAANPDIVRTIIQRFKAEWPKNQKMYRDWGTTFYVESLNKMGALPTHNFNDCVFEGAENITGQKIKEMIGAGEEWSHGCPGCPIRCKRKTREANGLSGVYGAPEYETIAAFGSNCGVSDLKAVLEAHEYCNANSIDSISAGTAISWVMECFEKGILTKGDTGGIEVRFGDADAMLEMLHMICEMRGFGAVLAEGVAKAARIVGKGAELAMHVKNQGMPFHEPRTKYGVALMYTLSPTGADHLVSGHDTGYSKHGPYIEAGSPLAITEPMSIDSLGPEKVRMFLYTQYWMGLLNHLGVCLFAAVPRPYRAQDIVDAVSAQTGWETSMWELMKVGQRGLHLARLFNAREGFKRADDSIPGRFREDLSEGPYAGNRIDQDELNAAIEMYYQMCGLDREGAPIQGVLGELGIPSLLSAPVDRVMTA